MRCLSFRRLGATRWEVVQRWYAVDHIGPVMDGYGCSPLGATSWTSSGGAVECRVVDNGIAGSTVWWSLMTVTR